MALSRDTVLKQCFGHFESYPCAASQTIYEGGMVGDNGSGYAVPYTSGLQFLGHAYQGVISSTTAGAEYVKVFSGNYRLEVTVPSVAITDKGQAVYATADGTYSLTGGIGGNVGTVVRYVGSNTAVVEFNPIVGVQPEMEASVIQSIGGTNTVKIQGYDVDGSAWVTGVEVKGHATVPAVFIANAATGMTLSFFGKAAGATQAANIVACATNETSGSNISPLVVSLITAMKNFGLVATA